MWNGRDAQCLGRVQRSGHVTWRGDVSAPRTGRSPPVGPVSSCGRYAYSATTRLTECPTSDDTSTSSSVTPKGRRHGQWVPFAAFVPGVDFRKPPPCRNSWVARLYRVCFVSVKFLEVIKPFCSILPEIAKPERKVSVVGFGCEASPPRPVAFFEFRPLSKCRGWNFVDTFTQNGGRFVHVSCATYCPCLPVRFYPLPTFVLLRLL